MAKSTEINSKQLSSPDTFFPPVVAVLGHVDHGKTTLLDTIRKTTIADRERGGITQRIGASSIELMHEGKKRNITFIDTPGHEAFAKMRGRGAIASDVGILVVAATDGVMPQTKESIGLLKDAGIPFIVALTKSDLPTKNVERVKQQLIKEEVLLEGYGGDVPVVEVSAKAGTNIKELLELILLVYEMHPIVKSRSEKAPLEAVVIESKLDPKIGPKATVVIRNGSIAVRDDIVCDGSVSRVRALMDTLNKGVKIASVGEAVEVLGFVIVPQVGSQVEKKGEEAEKKTVEVQKTAVIAQSVQGADGLPYFIETAADPNQLSLILYADTAGSLEAITEGLPREIRIASQKTGEVSSADILLAKSTGAIVLGFNAIIRPEISRLAMTEKVLLKNYSIIYELLDEIRDVLEGKRLALVERVLGKAKIQAQFPFEKTKVLGVVVLEGRIAKGDRVDIMRGEEVIGQSHINSLRHGKDPISKAMKGQEAGAIISPLLDFTIGDVLVSHS